VAVCFVWQMPDKKGVTTNAQAVSAAVKDELGIFFWG
jgi:hypothetical protein